MTTLAPLKRALASLWLKWLTPVGRNEVTSGRRLTLLTQSRLCPPAEDLEDLEQSGKAFKSGEEKAGSIDNIGDSRYLAYGRLS